MSTTANFAPKAGVPVTLAPMLHLVLAPNPSPMTFLGTNTYIIGKGTVAVLDPGPDDPAHLAALLAALGDQKVSHVLLTHSHLDHSPLARRLADTTGAAVCAFGDSAAGRSSVMQSLAAEGLAGGGEGIDHQFVPDIHLKDGASIDGSWGTITALHTPGHIGNHLCFIWDKTVFTGDHVMGWASSLVSPPDGDLTDFMASCTRLQAIRADRYYPGHGAPITDPDERLRWLIAHRQTREAQIIQALSAGPTHIDSLTKMIYDDIAPGMLPAAARNVFAHLIDLHQRGRVLAAPRLGLKAEFALAPSSRRE